MSGIEAVPKDLAELYENEFFGGFHNFYSWLPAGDRRDTWKKGIITDENIFKSEKVLSAFMRSKTVTEFLKDIDDAITQAGYTEEQVIREQNSYSEKLNSYMAEFTEFLFPIYAILRSMGYSYYDLVS